MPITIEQLSDIEDIKQCAQRYCRGVDRLDGPLMKSAYWEDATDDHGTYVGPAWPFVDHCMESHRRWRATSHCIFNHHIELDDNGIHARGEIYNVSYLFHKDEDRLDTWHGRYLDRYEKRGDEWRIIERVCVHEGTHTQSVDPMQIDFSKFRQDSFDRDQPGRLIGP